ncbi:prolow-density lipoprotein receptor-related protein 1-like [Ylistrum balloti]|uniref:prolow-density lipoprotein receptor-related protein 1-like n=1 Tax=Ylistrum balloti TaxID=509963 RepID=UPI002905A660|nr:prolow-density lipoprotein receptor-related protein 1-like [Ylistrum balloti]
MAVFGYVLGYILAVSFTTLSAKEALVTGFKSSADNTGSLYTYEGTVEQLSKQSTLQPIITSFSLTGVTITSITSDPQNDVLYFYDFYTQAIYKMSGFTSPNDRKTSFIKNVSGSINTNIAFDWITQNLYCTDGLLGWIFVVNMAASTDEDMLRILLDTNMETPKAITVDPKEGYMFWSDNYKGSTRVERAYLSGEQREVIVSTSLLSVGDVYADVLEKRLYWTDRGRYTIERCMYDGQQREIIHRQNNHIFSDIMTDFVHICVTEEYLDTLLCMYKGSSEYVLLEKYDRQPYGLEIFDSSRKPRSTDKCAVKTCQHFCVPTPAGATCVCKNGYTLQGDGVSCTVDHDVPLKGLLVGNNTHICVIDILGLVTYPLKSPTCFIENLQDLAFLSVDVKTMDVYFVDTGTNSINSFNLRTKRTISLASTGLVSGLAYDWFGRNLYWTETDTKKIKLVSVTTRASSDFSTSTLSPSDVTVDPHGRMVYWLSGSGTSQNTIQGVSTDGSMAPADVVSSGNSLTTLFYDTLGNRLYWVEAGTLKSSLGSGSDIVTHKALATQQQSQLLIYKMYVFWISSLNSQFHIMSMENKQLQTVDVNGFGVITGMALFDKSIQTLQPEPCSILNGGCSHVCIPTSDTERRCACTFGFLLQPDQTSCKSKPALVNNFLLMPDLNHARLYQLSLDTVAPEFLALDIRVDRPVDTIYDPVHQYVYWTEAVLRVIKRAKLDGSEVRTLLTFSQEYPERLAIDVSTGNLFYSTTISSDESTGRDGKIGVIRVTPDHVHNKVVVKDEGTADFIQGLLVYSKKGMLIWSGTDFDGGTQVGTIYRSFMDGSAVTLLVSDVNKPNGLAMDYTNERVYWSSYDGIEYTDLSGNKGILLQSSEQLTDLVLSGNVIYYTGRNTQKVVKIDKNTGANIHWLNSTAEVGIVFSIDIYTGEQQQGNTYCSGNNICDVYCLPTSTGQICACQDGINLQSDGKSCGSSVVCQRTISNGLISSFCTGIVGEVCSYECDSGYRRNMDYSTITCVSAGTWTAPRTDLCLVNTSPTTVPTDPLPVIVGVAGAVVVIIILVVLVVCLWRKKRKPQRFPDNIYLNNRSVPTVVQNQYALPQDIQGAVGPQVVVTPPTDFMEKNKINPAYLHPLERRDRCPSPDHVYAELPPAYSKMDPNYIHPMENEHDDPHQQNPYVDPEPIKDKEGFRQSRQSKRSRSCDETSPSSNVSYTQPDSLTGDREHDNPYLMPMHAPDYAYSKSVGSDRGHQDGNIKNKDVFEHFPYPSQQETTLTSSRKIYTGNSQKDRYVSTPGSSPYQISPPQLPSRSENSNDSYSHQSSHRRSSQQDDPYRFQPGVNMPSSHQLSGHDYLELGRQTTY